MTELILKTGKRIIPEQFESKKEYLLYLRHLFAYEFAKDNISKNSFVLEVGCGEGYGTSLISRSHLANLYVSHIFQCLFVKAVCTKP